MTKNKHRLNGAETAHVLVLLCCMILWTGCKPDKADEVYIEGQPTLLFSTPQQPIRIGDPVPLTLTAIYPTNTVLILPELEREKEIVVLKQQSDITPYNEDHTRETITYSLTSLRIGEHRIINTPIRYTESGSAITNELPAPEIKLSVKSVLSNEHTTELAELKAPQKLPGRIPLWLWIAVPVALAAFLVGRWIASRPKKEMIKPTAPIIPPHLVALQALDGLIKQGLLENDECNAFYTELSMILRTYLDGRFHLNAPDSTTEEIVEEMSQSPELSGVQRNILQEFMRQADMVKFAKGHPDRTTMESAFNTTQRFVKETAKTQQNEPRLNESY